MVTQKNRLDKLLIKRGIAPTLEKACASPVWCPADNREYFILARKNK
jgi:predicted rRNA methylase YqxC with S4 and FtsJ domains